MIAHFCHRQSSSQSTHFKPFSPPPSSFFLHESPVSPAYYDNRPAKNHQQLTAGPTVESPNEVLFISLILPSMQSAVAAAVAADGARRERWCFDLTSNGRNWHHGRLPAACFRPAGATTQRNLQATRMVDSSSSILTWTRMRMWRK